MRPIDYFDTAVGAHHDATAVIDGDVRLTYGQLSTLSEKVAGLFASVAVQGPARVAIISPNDYRVIACTLGAMRAGAAVMSIHAKDPLRTKRDFFAQVRPDWILYHSRIEGEIAQLKSDLGGSGAWVCLDRQAGRDESLDTALASAPPWTGDWGDVLGSPEHPVYIRQTSGTTGVPKIIVNDVGSFAATHAVLRHKIACDATHPACLVAAPLSHAAGVFAFSMLTVGATLVLMRDFDAQQVLSDIATHQITHLWLPPTALYLLLSCPDVRQFDYSSLRHLILGASAVAPEKLREAVGVFGPCVSLNYSQIEAGFLTWLDAAVVAAAVAGDRPERLSSSGSSLFVSRVATMDEDGRVLPRNETGEIVVRGRSVKPYLDPIERAEAQKFGWHHTGDLGFLDADGYLYVVGRKKDNIISGGFKVSAAEVEQVILELPQIHECAVVGVPHPVRGEAVVGVVAFRPGVTVTPTAILRHCRAKLGRGKAPWRIEEWLSLPKTSVGKIDKRLVREMLSGTPAADRVVTARGA